MNGNFLGEKEGETIIKWIWRVKKKYFFYFSAFFNIYEKKIYIFLCA